MEKLAGLDEIIGPPYHYLTITDKGILQSYLPLVPQGKKLRCLPSSPKGGIFFLGP